MCDSSELLIRKSQDTEHAKEGCRFSNGPHNKLIILILINEGRKKNVCHKLGDIIISYICNNKHIHYFVIEFPLQAEIKHYKVY